MLPAQDPLKKLYLNVVLALYLVTGFIAALLIEDEFDAVRATLFSAIGMPLVAIFYLSGWLSPEWHRSYTTLHRILVATIISVFALGHFTLLNAVCGKRTWTNVRVAYATKGFVQPMKEGAFGIVYRYRTW